MTMHDDPRVPDSRSDATVAVAPGVPTDRVRWPAIFAGTFAALTGLAILATLGAAIGLSSFDQGQDNPRNFALGYGVWGIISTILAFAFGGFLAARVAALRGRDNSLLNGMMVAAFGLPLLMYIVGSSGAIIGRAAVENAPPLDVRSTTNGDSAILASGQMSGRTVEERRINNANSTPIDRDTAQRAASRTAWATLLTMGLALGAASFGGYAGSRFPDNDRLLPRGHGTHA